MKNIITPISKFLTAHYKLVTIALAAVFVLHVSLKEGVFNMHYLKISLVAGTWSCALGVFAGMFLAFRSFKTKKTDKVTITKAITTAFSGGAALNLLVATFAIVLGCITLVYIGSETELTAVLVVSALTAFVLGVVAFALLFQVLLRFIGITTKRTGLLRRIRAASRVRSGRQSLIGGDYYEAYIGVLITAMLLGTPFLSNGAFKQSYYGLGAVMLPILIAIAGFLTSLIGFRLSMRDKHTPYQKVLLHGHLISKVAFIVVVFFLCYALLPEVWQHTTIEGEKVSTTFLHVFRAVLLGIFAGIFHKKLSEVNLQSNRRIWKNKVFRLINEFLSNIVPVFLVIFAGYVCFTYGGLYGVIMGCVGLFATNGMELSFEAFDTTKIKSIKFRHLRRKIRKELLFKSN